MDRRLFWVVERLIWQGKGVIYKWWLKGRSPVGNGSSHDIHLDRKLVPISKFLWNDKNGQSQLSNHPISFIQLIVILKDFRKLWSSL